MPDVHTDPAPDSWRARTPLAHLGLAARVQAAGGGIRLAECPLREQVALRGNAGDPAFLEAVETAVGVRPPAEPNTVQGAAELETGGARILWLGPDEWLVVAGDGSGAANALGAALVSKHAAVADVSDSRAVIALSGPHARGILAKGCPLDLHPRVFSPGRCAQSHLAKAHVLLHQLDTSPLYEVYIHRSFADYLSRWLQDASEEEQNPITP